MKERHFGELLKTQWSKGLVISVGLDSDYAQLPNAALIDNNIEASIFSFNAHIIDATSDLACAYKPNLAFYEAYGDSGLRALRNTIAHIQSIAPDIPVILDAKRADISTTNKGYIKGAFEYFRADAITVNPYLGQEALQPFLDEKNKGIIVLCRTSNPGSGEFQNLPVNGKPLYQIVAQHVAEKWNTHKNCGLVAGATYPEELKIIRDIIGDDLPILIPGIGAQGGDLEKTILASRNQFGTGIIINAARSLIFASNGSDFADAAREATLKLQEKCDVK